MRDLLPPRIDDAAPIEQGGAAIAGEGTSRHFSGTMI
jgi:hypothetical protein